MKLLIEPDAGVAPIVTAIKTAKKTIDIAIFRFDLREIEKALNAAVARGVVVRALIAQTNKGGEKSLRKLEQRLLEGGVTVSRTDDDLVRYHGKYMIVDETSLWLLGFNTTALDVSRSRSFGVMTTGSKVVKEAIKLFEADSNRQAFKSAAPDLVVSPENSRQRLSSLIKAAKRQLIIYDPKISDGPLLKQLLERLTSGVDVRVIGKVSSRGKGLASARLGRLRLHVRAIVRDGREAFIGSQSLRPLELDRRREVGLIIRDRRIARQILAVFEADWEQSAGGGKRSEKAGEKTEKDAETATA